MFDQSSTTADCCNKFNIVQNISLDSLAITDMIWSDRIMCSGRQCAYVCGLYRCSHNIRFSTMWLCVWTARGRGTRGMIGQFGLFKFNKMTLYEVHKEEEGLRCDELVFDDAGCSGFTDNFA
jgi:hypothetical protein